MDKATKLINAITNLISTLVEAFGAKGCIIILAITAIATVIWKIYIHRRKDAAYKALIAEKDRTISRMQDENKVYRIAELKQRGWSDADIKKYIKQE